MYLFRATSLVLASGLTLLAYALPLSCNGKYIITNVTSTCSNSTRNTAEWLEQWKHNRTVELDRMRRSLSQANHHPDLLQHLSTFVHGASLSVRLSDAPLDSPIDQVQERHGFNAQTQSRSPTCIEGVICDLPPTAPMCIPLEGVVCNNNEALSDSKILTRSPPLAATGVSSDKVQEGGNIYPQVGPFSHLDTPIYKAESSGIHHIEKYVLPKRQVTNLDGVGVDEDGYPCGGFIKCPKHTSISSQAPKPTKSLKPIQSPNKRTLAPSSNATTITTPSFTTSAKSPNTHPPTPTLTPANPPDESMNIAQAHAYHSGKCVRGQPCMTDSLWWGHHNAWSHAKCGFKPYHVGQKPEPDPSYKGEKTVLRKIWCWVYRTTGLEMVGF